MARSQGESAGRRDLRKMTATQMIAMFPRAQRVMNEGTEAKIKLSKSNSQPGPPPIPGPKSAPSSGSEITKQPAPENTNSLER